MNLRQAPSVQRHKTFPALDDLPTRQAVDELRAAVRKLCALHREPIQGRTVVFRAGHGRRLLHAVETRDAARASLESLFLEDT